MPCFTDDRLLSVSLQLSIRRTLMLSTGFPGGPAGKEPPCWCRRCKETRVQSLGQKDPLGEGNGNPFQNSCLGKSHGQRSLEGYSSWSCKKSDRTECARTQSYPWDLCCHDLITSWRPHLPLPSPWERFQQMNPGEQKHLVHSRWLNRLWLLNGTRWRGV